MGKTDPDGNFSCRKSAARKLWWLLKENIFEGSFSKKDCEGCVQGEVSVGQPVRGQLAVILTISAPEEFTNR